MAPAELITRMLKAAESWGRKRYGTEVVVHGHTEPECCADGTATAVVELERPASGKKVRQGKCLVVMDADGTLRCLEYQE